MRQPISALLSLLLIGPAFAATRSPLTANDFLKLNAPQQQSECEIKSNKVKIAHLNLGMIALINRYGIFVFGPASPPFPPSAYRDITSGTTFYVESDGRHVAAIDHDGKLLWVRNPYVDSNLCPYRSAHPYIVKLTSPTDGVHWYKPDYNATIRQELLSEIKAGRKAPTPQNNDRFLNLAFDSSNFGYLNIRNGDFYEMGQN